jgi:phospholipid N-methyltransferase
MEWLVFCQQFFKNPASVGSIVPSSRFLAHKLVGNIEWAQCKTVVELGAGTGAFTKQLLEHKPVYTRLLVFEKDPIFRAELAVKFRNVPLYDDAVRLVDTLAAEGIEHVECVVCGLPFAMFSHERRQDILAQIQMILETGGQFITFQYSPQLYKELCANFSEVKLGFALLNLPPAIIYTCRR